MAISDVPFEYEVDVAGERYQDPAYAGTDFTYYYSVAPKDYQLPSEVQHEILANLHFTKEDMIGDNPTELQKEEIDFYYDLNLEALKTTNNLRTTEKQELTYLFTLSDGTQQQLTYQEAQNQGLSLDEVVIDFSEIATTERRTSWNPMGIINVREDAINQDVGVAGALVRVRKWGWLVIRTARTLPNGLFIASSTRTKRVKYACYFKFSPFFTVKSNSSFWNARDRGTATHIRTPWFRNYNFGTLQFYALIQNAAYDYYFRIINQYGLSHPGYFKKIVAKNWYYASSHALNNVMSSLSVYNIRITIGSGGVYRGSDGIYATTIHELTHLGHRNMDPGMFSVFYSNSCNRAFLIESWAEGVETIVTNDRYNLLTDNNYQSSNLRDVNAGRQRWNGWRQESIVQNMTEYTPIVEDLIDNENQNISPNAPGNQPIDRVQDYNLFQIQIALNNCRDIDCWENNLRNLFNNTTENNLNELFNYMRAARANNNPNKCD